MEDKQKIFPIVRGITSLEAGYGITILNGNRIELTVSEDSFDTYDSEELWITRGGSHSSMLTQGY